MAATSRRLSSAMERTGQWVFSQEVQVPSDLIINVGDATFPLHKFIMMAKSGYIRNKILESGHTDLTRIDIADLPGGAEAFEKAVKFCYGINFEITVHNVMALRCAAECLEMTERVCDGNLTERTEEFMGQVAFKTLPGAIIVLRSCEGFLLRVADEAGLVQRCVDAISLKACNEANFPTRSPIDWWLSELISLPTSFLQKVVVSMKNRGASPKILSTILITYAEKSLPDSLHPLHSNLPISDLSPVIRKHQVTLLESIVSLLKSTAVTLPISFLCLLLRTAILLNTSTESKRELEKWIAADLDQASVGDLLSIALDCSGVRVSDLDSVRRIVVGFVDKEGGGLYGGGTICCSAVVQSVTKTVDAFVAEIATYEELNVSKFAGVAGALPKSARRFDDDVYRAVDIYLKAHPALDEIEKEKVCSVMDPLRLSHEARLHASQNKRLPVQVVLHALYYDQLKLRSGQNKDPSPPSASAASRNRAGTDALLMKENAELRSELAKMKLYLSDMEKNKKVGKKTTFFASVSKTLGKLNPFKLQASKDTSQIEEEVKVDVTKPRRRRFSIS